MNGVAHPKGALESRAMADGEGSKDVPREGFVGPTTELARPTPQLPRRRRLATVSVALFIAGCRSLPDAAPPSATSNGDPLHANWLGGGSTVSADRVAATLAVGDSDPLVRDLVRKATERLGGGTPAGLAARFSVCEATDASHAGLTEVRFKDAWVVRTVEELAFATRPEITQRQLAALQEGPSLNVRIVTLPDLVLVERTMLPEICIAQRISILEAYEAIVHELVHALRADPRSALTLAQTAPDERAFLLAFVQAPGGETEAYETAVAARLRLHHTDRLTSPILRFFDRTSGALVVPPVVLADAILAPLPEGLGYADGRLRDSYTNAWRKVRESLSLRSTLIEEALKDRQRLIDVATANVDIHTSNVAVHRHNVQVASARGMVGLKAREAAALDESRKELERTHTLLATAQSSKTRLEKDIASLREQIGAADARRGMPSR